MSKTEMKNLIEELEKIVKNSYSLLENLLEWARFQTGALKYNPEFFYIKDSIEYVIKILQPIAQQKNIKIESKLRKKFIVYADKFMINTILRNLINNAIKFTYSNGHITISQKKMKNFLKISVKDNGIGIDKIILDKLFKLEESFSAKGTNKEKGTGLGLILCKEFIEINKGKIGVKTKKNIGTEFYFTIPMDVNHDK